ncbi:MAG: hypothetical protein EZS28_047378, partial [Streblomastix strix]
MLEQRILGNAYTQMALTYIGSGDYQLRKLGLLYMEGIRSSDEKPNQDRVQEPEKFGSCIQPVLSESLLLFLLKVPLITSLHKLAFLFDSLGRDIGQLFVRVFLDYYCLQRFGKILSMWLYWGLASLWKSQWQLLLPLVPPDLHQHVLSGCEVGTVNGPSFSYGKIQSV